MKRIHFDEVGGNWRIVGISILAIAFACILVGAFGMIDFANSKMNAYLTVVGFLIPTIYHSKIFWYKNYVQWNKRGIFIRNKSFLGKSLKFDEIKKTELVGKNLTIFKSDGNKLTFDLKEISESDTQKLNEIIVKNTISNNVLE
jgi:hypothetical protein